MKRLGRMLLALIIGGLMSLVGGSIFATADQLGNGGTTSAVGRSTVSTDGLNSHGPLKIEWDGPAIDLGSCEGCLGQAEGSLVGNPVAVPGDRIERGVTVRNTGPGDAQVLVQMVDVTASGPIAVANDLADSIHLFWLVNGQSLDQTAAALISARGGSGVSASTSFLLSKGTSFALTAGFYMPSETTTGLAGNELGAALTFNIRVTLQGSGSTVEVPEANQPGGATAQPPQAGTGGVIVDDRADQWVLAVIATALVGIGACLAGRIRRRQASVAQR
ncbi:MAG: hypothetical protein LBV30_10580 [Propionibacteriaceae bacterium]|nr:hypothetical protein [Propionibacteriaceae bacterium]